MAWTTPLTAVDGSFTAAQFNTHIRDNLMETFPGKATDAGQYFITNGTHSITTATTVTDYDADMDTGTSTSYADLSPSGPSVTAVCKGKALVYVSAKMSNSSSNTFTGVSFSVSGATSISASDTRGAYFNGLPAGEAIEIGAMSLVESLTAGTHTFTMKYKVGGGTGTFWHRRITVIPF